MIVQLVLINECAVASSLSLCFGPQCGPFWTSREPFWSWAIWSFPLTRYGTFIIVLKCWRCSSRSWTVAPTKGNHCWKTRTASSTQRTVLAKTSGGTCTGGASSETRSIHARRRSSRTMLLSVTAAMNTCTFLAPDMCSLTWSYRRCTHFTLCKQLQFRLRNALFNE